MPKASQEGLIFIDGSGPTYATKTVITTQTHLTLMNDLASLWLQTRSTEKLDAFWIKIV